MANWGEAGKGAVGGAATGAGLGSAIAPGIGTAIGAGAGALIGGLGGLFGGDEPERPEIDRNNFNVHGFNSQYGGYTTRADLARNRDAPTFGTSGFRQGQTTLGRMLMSQAQGNGPGQQLARQHAQQMADRGVAQQMAMAQSGRPGGGALAARRAAMNAGDINAQATQAAVQGGLQAQLAATGQLGQFLQGARAQDLQRNVALTDAQLRQMGLNDQREAEMLRQRLQLAGMQQQGGIDYEAMRQGQYQFDAGQPSFGDRMLGAGAGVLGSYLAGRG